MASPRSPPVGARRISRHISHPITRRSTKGPLDTTDDPLSAATDESSNIASDEPSPTDARPTTDTKAFTAVRTGIIRTLPPQLRFVQDPRLYLQIPRDDVPVAFLESSMQPAADTPLADLLKHGHFRRAAESALQELLRASLDDASLILQLLYCRLACLTLIGRSDMAADEALPLLDLLSSNAPGITEILPMVPWALRILLVKLLSVAAQDGGRRAIMTLYALAGEVRTNIREARSAGHTDAVEVWGSRLSDLGLRVSDTLVEIGELETASRHLDSLQDVDQDGILTRKTLLCISTGDEQNAKDCIQGISDPQTRAIFEALLTTIDEDFTHASTSWRSLAQHEQSRDLAIHNQAVYLLYTGHIEEGLHMLENLVEKGAVFGTLLFNLSTIHELCSDKAQTKKQSIAAHLASRSANSTTAWERSTAELKL